MTVDCCDNAGGRVIFMIGNLRYPTRGGVTIKPTVVERTEGANDDGSIYVTTKAVPAMAEFKLSDRCGLPIANLDKCRVDVSIEMVDMNRRYLFTQASLVGRPEINSETGEISGLKVASSFVTQIG
jgi:hypothetical protein